MIEIVGDIWSSSIQYKCVTTNGVLRNNGELVMGAGIALQAKQRFPELPARLGKNVSMFGNKPFIFHDIGIISFPTKHHWKDKSDIGLIRQSAEHIVGFVKALSIKEVALTRCGCGLGGLVWSNVKSVLEPILDDRFKVYNESV